MYVYLYKIYVPVEETDTDDGESKEDYEYYETNEVYIPNKKNKNTTKKQYKNVFALNVS